MPDPLNIAHRGARSLAPENTLAAAAAALHHGADMWEADVTLSADGVPYLLHDDTLNRTTDVATRFPERGSWRSDALSWDALRQLDAGSWFVERDPFGQIAAGVVPVEQQRRYVGEPLLSLAAALAFTRDHEWWINLEVKDLSGQPGDGAIIPAVWEAVARLGMEDRVLISSFNHGYLRQTRALDPAVKLGVLVRRNTASPHELVRSLDAQAYHPPETDPPSESQIERLHDAGHKVYVWTVNEVASAHRLLGAGVDGLITDFPQAWDRFLAGQNLRTSTDFQR